MTPYIALAIAVALATLDIAAHVAVYVIRAADRRRPRR